MNVSNLLLIFAIFGFTWGQAFTQVGSNLVVESGDATFSRLVHLSNGNALSSYVDSNSGEIEVRLFDMMSNAPSLLGAAVVASVNETYHVSDGMEYIGRNRAVVSFYSGSGDGFLGISIVDCSSGAPVVTGTLIIPSTYGGSILPFLNSDKAMYIGRNRLVIVEVTYGAGNLGWEGYLIDVSGTTPTIITGPSTLFSSSISSPPVEYDVSGASVVPVGNNRFILTSLVAGNNGLFTQGELFDASGDSFTSRGGAFSITPDSNSEDTYFIADAGLYGGKGYMLVTFSRFGGNADGGNVTYGDVGVLGRIYDTKTSPPSPLGAEFVLNAGLVDGYQGGQAVAAFSGYRAFVASWTDTISKDGGVSDAVYGNLFCFDAAGNPTQVGTTPTLLSESGSSTDDFQSALATYGSRIAVSFIDSNTGDLNLRIYDADLSSCARIASASSSSSALEGIF